jgi:hypothetical protein
MKNLVRISFLFALAVSAFSAETTAQTLIDDLQLGGNKVLDQTFVIDGSSNSIKTQLVFNAAAPSAALIVLNGDIDGLDPMRGGRASLNGESVLGSPHFKITGAIILRVPVLEGENVFDIVLRGTVGSTLSIQILQEGTPPPPPVSFPPGTIFVSATHPSAVDDASCGTAPATPCITISFGLSRGYSTGGPQVAVAEGTYNEDVTLIDDIDVFGGFNQAFDQRDIPLFQTIISGTATITSGVSDYSATVVAANILNPTMLEGFTIAGPNVTAPSANSMGILIRDSNGSLWVAQNVITGGAAGHGLDGIAGPPGLPGPDGDNGDNAVEGIAAIGGSGGPGPGTSGGKGGDGVPALSGGSGTNGEGPGGGTGGAGGQPGSADIFNSCSVSPPPGDGGQGNNGSTGSSGPSGDSGSGGSVVAGEWVPSDGTAGEDGINGSGGGGGGAGGGVDIGACGLLDIAGGAGGGGGAGGTGGSGGTGGKGGGAAFAIFIDSTEATPPTISDNTINLGTGGRGGNGRPGGAGGAGGNGGSGGSSLDLSGAGGNGGFGGGGGAGGGGGGGAGGHSVGISGNVDLSGYTAPASNNNFQTVLGVGGAGGNHGGAGLPGDDGQVLETLSAL